MDYDGVKARCPWDMTNIISLYNLQKYATIKLTRNYAHSQ